VDEARADLVVQTLAGGAEERAEVGADTLLVALVRASFHPATPPSAAWAAGEADVGGAGGAAARVRAACGAAAPLALCKPFAYQLKDPGELLKAKWWRLGAPAGRGDGGGGAGALPSLSDDAPLAGEPLKLRSGDPLVWAPAEEVEAALRRAAEDAAAACGEGGGGAPSSRSGAPSSHSPASNREKAFRIAPRPQLPPPPAVEGTAAAAAPPASAPPDPR